MRAVIRHSLSLVLVLMIGKLSPVFAAAPRPLWEAGLGIGVVSAPDYRGADEGRTYVLPVPYFVYYGKRLNVDRRGLRGRLFGGDRVLFTLSAGLGLPANSSENSARAGMPNLDPTIEIGPSLRIRLNDHAGHNPSLSLRLPLRTVIATDLSHARNIGWLFLPHLALSYKNVGPGGDWNLGLSAGLIFATRAYHDYYYTVRPEFATPTRPAFQAHGGYSGAGVGVTFSRRAGSYWMGAFVRYDDLHGAVFEDSPLVRSSHALLFGIAFSRILASSAQPARSPAPVP